MLRGWRLNPAGTWLGPGDGTCTRTSQPKNTAAAAARDAVGSAALAEHRAPPAAPQAEQQEFGSSWAVGFAPLSVLQQELKGAAGGAALGGLCTPEFPLGMVTLGVCSVLSSLVLWLLFEICLKPLHTRSWKLPG